MNDRMGDWIAASGDQHAAWTTAVSDPTARGIVANATRDGLGSAPSVRLYCQGHWTGHSIVLRDTTSGITMTYAHSNDSRPPYTQHLSAFPDAGTTLFKCAECGQHWKRSRVDWLKLAVKSMFDTPTKIRRFEIHLS